MTLTNPSSHPAPLMGMSRFLRRGNVEPVKLLDLG